MKHGSHGSLGALGRGAAFALLALSLATANVAAQTPAQAAAAQPRGLPSIADRTTGMKAMPGFFNLYLDEAAGKLYWEIDKLDTEFLYQVSMASGLGSNPVGIDRGQLGGTFLLVAKRAGPKVLLIEPNYRYRATSNNPDEVDAVRDAFAPSVHGGLDIVAQTGASVLVDATSFFMRDARGVARQIAQRQQGTFVLDASRSALYPERIKSFPDNNEIEALLTFTSSNPGRLVNEVAATGEAVTLREHHSLVRLPGPGFKTRIADPRIGVLGTTIMDFGKPLEFDLTTQLAARHRLQKKNPGAAPSEPVKPIMYYLDRGVPEPVRGALIEGARWWNEAYAAAGFINAFRVEVLPEGADPDDIRYNMIHWTHRRTRGYSYGNIVEDPRTGEIIRGNVNLGSDRLRQDYLHGQGMVAPFPEGDDGDDALADGPDAGYLAAVAENTDAKELALARVRQLSAHEVGHTIGLPHNYLGSSHGRNSVMDYPAPLAKATPQGTIDLSQAYAREIGEYDKLSIKWLYEEIPDGVDETQRLRAIADSGVKAGLLYMGYTNNNFIGAGHQYASVWDNGSNLVDQLIEEMKVRKIGLDKFGPQAIRPGEPMSKLEFVLLPLYMHHRFQLRSAAQSIGGANYSNAVRGDGQTPYTIVPAAEQRRALETILSTLSVDFLALPDRIVKLIPPPAERQDEGEGEGFEKRTDLLFDPLAAAEASASFTVGEILHPARMARLISFGAQGDYPTLEEVVDRLIAVTWGAPTPTDKYRAAIQQVVQRATVDEMMTQASYETTSDQARAVLTDRLHKLAARLTQRTAAPAHVSGVVADIRRWENRSEKTIPAPALRLPPGDPIGSTASKSPR